MLNSSLLKAFPHKTQRELLDKTRRVLGSRQIKGPPDPIAVVDLQNFINTLSLALESERQVWEDRTWRLAFISSFARKLQNAHPRVLENLEELSNDSLSEFFRVSAAEIRVIEVEPSERLSKVVGLLTILTALCLILLFSFI